MHSLGARSLARARVCICAWNTFSCTKSNMKTISPKVAKRFFNNTAGGFFLFLLSCCFEIARTLFSPSLSSMPCAAVSFFLSAELLFEELQQRASIIWVQGAVCTYYFSYTRGGGRGRKRTQTLAISMDSVLFLSLFYLVYYYRV
jgi:hypothetical protein